MFDVDDFVQRHALNHLTCTLTRQPPDNALQFPNACFPGIALNQITQSFIFDDQLIFT